MARALDPNPSYRAQLVRILHVVTRYQRGGTERDVSHLARWELSRGHDVHVAIGRESLSSEVPAGVTTHVVNDLVRRVSPVHDIKAFASLRRLISAGTFDLVHTHQSKAGVLGRLAARGQARWIVHTISLPSFGAAYSRGASAFFVLAERVTSRFTDAFIAVGSELVAMYLAAGIGDARRYHVIRSPIDIDAFLRVRAWGEEDRRVMRGLYRVDPNVPMAAVVATLEPRKRVGLVIRELAPEISRGSLSLVVAGEGELRSELEGLISELRIADGVRLLGHVDDVPAFMGAANVLVCAGSAEGVPQVVLQALAAGLPVVATNTIGLREVVGAPVSIVPRDGKGLAAAVQASANATQTLVAAEDLDEWTAAAVDDALARLYQTLAGAGP